eukprot:365473-Chlamydomonas_euryale.AAC.2
MSLGPQHSCTICAKPTWGHWVGSCLQSRHPATAQVPRLIGLSRHWLMHTLEACKTLVAQYHSHKVTIMLSQMFEVSDRQVSSQPSVQHKVWCALPKMLDLIACHACIHATLHSCKTEQ